MYLNVLKNNKNVLFYLLGAGASNLGNVITGLAFLFLAYEMTESTLHTTGVAISQVLPYLLFGLVGGVIADSVDKKKLLIKIDLISVPLILSLVALHQFELLNYWHLIIVSFIIQCLGCFFNPAHRAILPVITKEEERTTVNSFLDTVTRGVTVLGPIASVGLMNTIGIIHFFTLDAFTYLISAILIYKIRLQEKDSEISRIKTTDIISSIRDFAVWAYRQVTIRTLFIVTVIIVFFNTWVWQVGLLLQLMETRPNGEELYSILLGWYGAAVIAINLLVPIMWKKLNMKIYLIGSLIWGLGIFILGLATNTPLYFIGVLVTAIGLPISGLARVYLLQQYLPTNKLGRGFSFNAFLLYLSNAISLGIFGFISSFVSTHILFLICGLMMIVSSGVYLLTILRNKPGVMPYKRLNS
ncbi:MFS transporter [Ornithinibacillus bavariensis]|uniref:MFS transporter n=1 Tax=Ornithinibacillus bavariensis TaxID=545502 RepID=A0A920C6W3_9BACI|nr:MFS transporter [Ornithinibacillus bavariensis]GIO26529.1 MFS transporter [Ornithinibacillus bavariensis]